MTDHNAAIRAYLQYVLSTTGDSPNALAKKVGIAPSTITRYLNNPSHKFTISNTTLNKIYRATNISPATFLDGGKMPEVRADLFHGKEYSDVKAIVTTIELEADAGKWIEKDVYQIASIKLGAGIPPIIENDDTFYAIVRGYSCNMIAEDEDILFCFRCRDSLEKMYQTKLSALHNKFFVIERRVPETNLIECSVRLVKAFADRVEFVSPSTQERFFKNVSTVKVEDLGKGEVVLKGMILSVVRRLELTLYADA